MVMGVIRPILEFRASRRYLDADRVHVPAQLGPAARGAQYIDVIGRLKPGVTLAQANAEFKPLPRAWFISIRIFINRSMDIRLKSIRWRKKRVEI